MCMLTLHLLLLHLNPSAEVVLLVSANQVLVDLCHRQPILVSCCRGSFITGTVHYEPYHSRQLNKICRHNGHGAMQPLEALLQVGRVIGFGGQTSLKQPRRSTPGSRAGCYRLSVNASFAQSADNVSICIVLHRHIK